MGQQELLELQQRVRRVRGPLERWEHGPGQPVGQANRQLVDQHRLGKGHPELAQQPDFRNLDGIGFVESNVTSDDNFVLVR